MANEYSFFKDNVAVELGVLRGLPAGRRVTFKVLNANLAFWLGRCGPGSSPGRVTRKRKARLESHSRRTPGQWPNVVYVEFFSDSSKHEVYFRKSFPSMSLWSTPQRASCNQM